MPWTKGHSGNPHGRPKNGEAMTDALRSYAEGKYKNRGAAKTVLAKRLWELAMTCDDAVGIAAIRYIYDRLEGKPKEAIQLTGDMEYRIILPGDEPSDDKD